MRRTVGWGALLLSACSGEAAAPVPPPPPPPAAPAFHLELIRRPSTGIIVQPGTTVQLTPSLVAGGVVIPPTDPVTIESGATSIATVTSAGLLTAVANGATYLLARTTYTGFPLADSIDVNVIPVCTLEVSLRMTPSDTTIRVGDHIYPTLLATSCGGRVILNDPIFWSSGDGFILQVDPVTGESIGRGTGSTFLRATTNPSRFSTNIVVKVQ